MRIHCIRGVLLISVLWSGFNTAWAQPANIKNGEEHLDEKDRTAFEDSFKREENRVATLQKQADPRVIVLDGGKWKVEKAGSEGTFKQSASVMERGKNDSFVTTQKGAGLEDNPFGRGVTQLEIATYYLRKAQRYQYVPMKYDGNFKFKSAEAVERDQRGDCAGKSNWLASKLTECGVPCQIVGGYPPYDGIGHAWVEATLDGKKYYLDGTRDEGVPLAYEVMESEFKMRYPKNRITFDREGVKAAEVK